MSSTRGKTWHAEPHTLAKIAILKGYLQAYFPILGRTMAGRDILYVDGFAGPGEYDNAAAGSPVAALDAAMLALSQTGAAWRAGILRCAFIEPHRKRFQHLVERVTPWRGRHAGLDVLVLNESFVEGIETLRARVPLAFVADHPLFLFIDPFGATGVPFGVVEGVLTSRRSEVLLNFDADGIARIFRAEEAANRDALLNSIFGNESWREALSDDGDFPSLCRHVLELYKQRLRSLKDVDYVLSFEMRGPHDTLNYNLVFASQNPLGLEKMKEAMKLSPIAASVSTPSFGTTTRRPTQSCCTVSSWVRRRRSR